MKRVLIFSVAYHPFVGGAEVAVKEITDRIDPESVSFTMITPRFDSSLPAIEKIGNVTVYRIGFTRQKPSMGDLVRFPLVLNKYIFPFIAHRTARRLHHAEKFDAIWSIMANVAGFAALFFKKAVPEVPFILTLQEGDPIPEIKRKVTLVYPWFEQIFRRADHIQAISHYLADFAKSMGATAPIDVIPNAVDVAHFSRVWSAEERAAARKHIGLTDADRCLITTSRLVPKNGIADVIQAMTRLPDHVHFAILGIGPDEAQLKQLTQDLGVQARVHFLGQVDHADIPRYLQSSDIFIRPSLSEGMGNSFIEAMAARIPVIATPVGGIVDFLFDPDTNQGTPSTGLFCAVQDPASIVRSVERVLSDAELRERLVENAYQLVSTQYDWNLIARRMLTTVFSVPK